MTITSKPDYGSPAVESNALTSRFQLFFDDIERFFNENLLGPVVQLPVFTVATLPVIADLPNAVVGGMIYVSDETGGPVPAFSDGVDWRRVTDRQVVS